MATLINVKNIFYCILMVCATHTTLLLSGNGFSCCSNEKEFKNREQVRKQFKSNEPMHKITRGKTTIIYQQEQGSKIIEVVKKVINNTDQVTGTIYFSTPSGVVKKKVDNPRELEEQAKTFPLYKSTVLLQTPATFGW